MQRLWCQHGDVCAKDVYTKDPTDAIPPAVDMTYP